MLCGSWHAATVDAKGADMNTSKALVLAGIKGVFVDRDPTVLDRLFSDNYQQHNPRIPNGTAAIKALLGNLPADFRYEPGLVVAEGDYVAIHGRYFGWGPPGAPSANGNSMLTSPQE